MKQGFPEVTTVKYRPRTATYHTLEEQCLATGMLPSLAYGGKSCSLKYKRTPQDRWILGRYPEQEVYARGWRVVRAIGFEAGEERRTYAGAMRLAKPKARKTKEDRLDRHYFHYWYPLQEWGWDRARCVREIRRAGLAVPVKSACFFCPAMKMHEILALCREHPDLYERAIAIERNAQARLTSVKGLGRGWKWEERVEQRRFQLTLFEE
jgi:hypothetical protein